MDFQYVQDQYDSIIDDIFDSSLMFLATVNIAFEQVPTEGLYGGYGDSLDGRTDSIKQSYYFFVRFLARLFYLELFSWKRIFCFG